MKVPQYTTWRHYSAQQTDFFFMVWCSVVNGFFSFSEQLEGHLCSQPLSHFAAFSLLNKTADRAWEDALSGQAKTSSISLDFKQFSYEWIVPTIFLIIARRISTAASDHICWSNQIKNSLLSFSMTKDKGHVQTMSTAAKHTDQHFYKGFMGFWHAGWTGSGFLLSLWTHV